jgi:small subunit ribosomal protein S19
MSRSLWKGPFISGKILKKVIEVKKMEKKNYKPIRVYSRNFIIFPSFVGLFFEIYNGLKFITIEIKENMIGFKFGEFVFTRKTSKNKKR